MQINLLYKRLDIFLFFTILCSIVLPIFIPPLRLSFFAPLLIIACYQYPLSRSLWMAFASGLFIDLLSSHEHLGIYTLNYCLTLAVLYPRKKNFFSDSLSTLPLMTFFFSFLSTIILAALMHTIEKQNLFSKEWMLADLLIMPVADGVFSFLIFIAPAYIFGKRPRRGKEYFLSNQ